MPDASASWARPADRVRALRARYGLSQERLAALIGVSFASVNRWERGAVAPGRVARSRIAVLEAHGPSGATPGPSPTLAVVDGGLAIPPGWQVAAPPTSLVGRDAEASTVAAYLGDRRVVTLTGSGGCGKTRLALAVAARLAVGGSDDIVLVDVEAIEERAHVAPEVARAVGARPAPGRAPLEAVVGVLHRRRLLLVLDGCETSIEGCRDVIDAIVRSCAGVRVLATSRLPLGVAGETVWRVPPLSMPPDGVVDPATLIATSEAVRLFVERARERQPAFALDASSAAAVTELCRRLDGMPLAIELAAAWVSTLSVQEIVGRLAGRFDSLDVPGTDRRRTLRSTLEWTYERLAPADRRLFDRLSVFVGEFTAADAAAVCAEDASDVTRGLRQLVESSLVVAHTGQHPSRFRLLETLRALGVEHLEHDRSRDAVRLRHAERLVALAQAAADGLDGPRPDEWLTRLDRAEPDLRAALGWCRDADRPDLGLRLAGLLSRRWYITADLAEGSAWLRTFLSARVGSGSVEDRARAYYGLAMLASEQGDYRTAIESAGEAAAAWEATGDLAGVADALKVQGSAEKYRGDAASAARLYARCLAIARTIADERREGVALNNLGVVAVESGDLAAAEACFLESEALKRAAGDKRGIAVSGLNLADVAIRMAQPARARALLEESLATFRDIGDRRGVGLALNNLGEVDRAVGDASSAVLRFEEALAIFRSIGDRRDEALALVNLGLAALDRGAAPEASGHLRAALGLARSIADGQREREAMAGLATLEETNRGRDQRDGQLGIGRVGWGRVPPGSRRGAPRPDGLTAREVEVLGLLATGASNREIADALFISVPTVQRHLANIYAKIGAVGRVQAATYAVDRGLGPARPSAPEPDAGR